jgi:hypothetical protein
VVALEKFIFVFTLLYKIQGAPKNGNFEIFALFFQIF